MADEPPSHPGWNVREPAASPHGSPPPPDPPYGSSLPPGSPVAPPPPTPAYTPSPGGVPAPPQHAPAPPPFAAPAPPPLAWGQPVDQFAAPPPTPGKGPGNGSGKKMAVIGVALAVVVAGAVSGILLTRPHTPAPAPASAAAAAATAGPTPAPTATDTPTAAPGSTTAFADPDGYFTASFTASPVKDASNVAVGSVTIPYVQWANLIDVSAVQVVAYANYPRSVNTSLPNVVLAGALAGSAAETKGKLLSKVFGSFDGFPDADGIIAAPNNAGYAEVRVILAGHTLFEVIASGLDNPPALFGGLAASFTILKHSS